MFAKWRHSIFNKIIIALLLCLTIPPAIVLTHILTNVRQDLLVDRGQDSVQLIVEQETEISILLGNVLANLQFLSRIPALTTYLENPDDVNRNHVTEIFSAFLESESIYDQVRLLSPEGMELIRINYENQEAIIVAESDLQDKSDRDYFQESVNLQAGEVYVSELNLNQENGVFEEPYTPTLRYATPLFDDDNQLAAILVFNLIPNQIFHIANQRHPDATYYVANSRGDVMYTNVADAEAILYASDLGHEERMQSLFPTIPDRPAQADFLINEMDNRLLTYTPIIVNGDVVQQRQWLLVREVALSDITMSVNQIVMTIIVVGLASTVISLLIAVPVIRAIVKLLHLLLSASNHLIKHNWQDSIALSRSVKSNDEVGQLATAFEEAVHELRNLYTQLETLVKDRTLELQWANEQLKHVDTVKTKFMEDIAHDIRTPLTSILVNMSMLRRKPDEMERYTERVEQHVQRINALIENINMMSKVELSFENTRVSKPMLLHEIIEPIIENHRTSIEEMGLELETNIAEVPAINGQRILLEQLFENLYTNAIKYTLSGKINIRLSHDGKNIVLLVEDTGIGIAEKEIPLVKRRYYRAENVRQSAVPGTGIGLSIVQDTIQFHEGSFQIESTVDVGTKVTITLPIKGENIEESNEPS